MSTTKIERYRKYDAMEYFLQQVNKHIRLPYTEIEINNKILDEVNLITIHVYINLIFNHF